MTRQIERLAEWRDAHAALGDGRGYALEVRIRALLWEHGIPTSALTAIVLHSIAIDQFADHDRETFLNMARGLHNTAREGLDRGALCRNEACRASTGMTREVVGLDAGACMFCGASLDPHTRQETEGEAP